MAGTYQAMYRQKGDAIDYTPGADVDAGDVVVLEDKVLVTVRDIESGHLGSLVTEGVFRVIKESVAFSVGDDVYWDETNELAIAETGAYMGWAIADAAADDDTVDVKLNQQESAVSSTETGSGTGG